MKKITAQWPGQREMEGIQSAPFLPAVWDKKADIVALKLVLFLLNNVRHWELTRWKKQGEKKNPNVLIKIVQIWWWSREKAIESMCSFSPLHVFSLSVPLPQTSHFPNGTLYISSMITGVLFCLYEKSHVTVFQILIPNTSYSPSIKTKLHSTSQNWRDVVTAGGWY